MSGGAYDNPFLDSMYDAAARRMGQNFQENIVSGITDREVGSGQYGGSRGAIAEGIAARAEADALGDLASNVYGNAYNLGFGAMADLTGAQQQGEINRFAQNANLDQQANMTNAGFQQAANLANAGFQQEAGVQGAANQLAALGLGLEAQLANQGADLSGQTTNAANNLTAVLANQAADNAAKIFAAESADTAALTGQDLNASIAAQNAASQNAARQQFADRALSAQEINARNELAYNQQRLAAEQQNLNNLIGSFALPTMGLNSMMQTGDTLMSTFQFPQQQEWNDLYRYAGIINPTSNPYNSQNTANQMSGVQMGSQLLDVFTAGMDAFGPFQPQPPAGGFNPYASQSTYNWTTGNF
jgi:hypothetical protein